MKKLIMAVLGCAAVLLLVFLVMPRYSAKRAALVEVGRTLVHTRFNQLVVIEGARHTFKAQYNVKVIARATRYASLFGSGTGVFREIIRIAAKADVECERLETVLDLAARSLSHGHEILILAESACRIANPAQAERWQAAYDSLSEQAEYSSLSAAVAARTTQ